jgi:indolepyruvate ferredoxin oxidoreductase alpha subunit
VALILERTLSESGIKAKTVMEMGNLETALAAEAKPPRRPTLCPGCPHRSAFFAIRKAFPKAIYTSDIGCYTLGINLRAVDTCLNMGAAVSMASGFNQAYRQDGQDKPVIATIGDSTFFHSGLTGLLNAVYTDSRFILVILDNRVTAMTGMQPAMTSGMLADGTQGNAVSIEDAVRGCGVKWMKVVEPYDFEAMKATLLEAQAHTRAERGGVAVIIARAPCLINERPAAHRWMENSVDVDPEVCKGCGLCVKAFECPALIQPEKKAKVHVDHTVCVNCGSCLFACKEGALKVTDNPGSGASSYPRR